MSGFILIVGLLLAAIAGNAVRRAREARRVADIMAEGIRPLPRSPADPVGADDDADAEADADVPASIDEPAHEPVDDPMLRPVGERAHEPVDDPMLQPVGEPAHEPVGEPAEALATQTFQPTCVHVDRRGGSMLALDPDTRLIELVMQQAGQLERARLPMDQLESAMIIEDGASADDRKRSVFTRSVALRVGLPDERRSLFDIEFLGRTCRSGSNRHRHARQAADAWLARLSGDTTATIDRCSVPDPWGRQARIGHGLAASATVVALGAFLIGGMGVSALKESARQETLQAEADLVRSENSPLAMAQRFEESLPSLEAGVAELHAGSGVDDDGPTRSSVDDASARFDGRRTRYLALQQQLAEGRALPLDSDLLSTLDRLAEQLADARHRDLPHYRRTFANDARRGADPVDARTVGKAHRMLELTRHDLGNAETRGALWSGMADDVRRLGFERVEFRAYRGGEVIDVLAIDEPLAPSRRTASVDQ